MLSCIAPSLKDMIMKATVAHRLDGTNFIWWAWDTNKKKFGPDRPSRGLYCVSLDYDAAVSVMAACEGAFNNPGSIKDFDNMLRDWFHEWAEQESNGEHSCNAAYAYPTMGHYVGHVSACDGRGNWVREEFWDQKHVGSDTHLKDQEICRFNGGGRGARRQIYIFDQRGWLQQGDYTKEYYYAWYTMVAAGQGHRREDVTDPKVIATYAARWAHDEHGGVPSWQKLKSLAPSKPLKKTRFMRDCRHIASMNKYRKFTDDPSQATPFLFFWETEATPALVSCMFAAHCVSQLSCSHTLLLLDCSFPLRWLRVAVPLVWPYIVCALSVWPRVSLSLSVRSSACYRVFLFLAHACRSPQSSRKEGGRDKSLIVYVELPAARLTSIWRCGSTPRAPLTYRRHVRVESPLLSCASNKRCFNPWWMLTGEPRASEASPFLFRSDLWRIHTELPAYQKGKTHALPESRRGSTITAAQSDNKNTSASPHSSVSPEQSLQQQQQ